MATVPVEEASASAPPASGPSRWRPRRPSPRAELLLGILGLIAIAAFSYTWYIQHGGIWDDDWKITSALISNRPDGGYWSGISELWGVLSWRPVLVAYNGLIVAPLGWHLTLQFTWSVAVSVVFVALLFQLLRTRGIASVHAFAIAALVLVASFGDSGVLWISGATIRFAAALYLAGLLVALRALQTDDPRRARRLHAVAVVLYVTSILSYEVTAGLILAGILVYLTAAPRRRALRQWAVDVVATALALVWSAAMTPRPTRSLADDWDHAKVIAQQVWDRYGGVAAPSWFPEHLASVLTVVAGLAGLGYVILIAQGRIGGGPGAEAVRRWTIVLGIGLVYVAAAYVVFVPGESYYVPNGIGISNRFNSIAVAPLILVAYASVMVLVSLATAFRPRWAPVATAVALAYAVGMFTVQHHALKADQRAWVADYDVSKNALATVRQLVPHPARGTYVVMLGVPAMSATGNPVFYASWDFTSALRKQYGDPTLSGFNAANGTSCTEDGLNVVGGEPLPYGAGDNVTVGDGTGRYGSTVLVDVAHRRAYPLGDYLSCQRAANLIAG